MYNRRILNLWFGAVAFNAVWIPLVA